MIPVIRSILSLTKRFSLVVRFARIALPEYRFIEPLLTWQKDVDFNEYLRKFREPFDYNDYRRFALRELLKLTSHIPGDTAEVGCYMGATSYLILKHIQEVSRQRNGQSFPKSILFLILFWDYQLLARLMVITGLHSDS